MRILWVATKAPCPITDGGRAVMLATIEALVAAGASVTVVTPLPIEALPIDGDASGDPGDRKSDGKSTIVRFVQGNPRFLRTNSYFLNWPNSMVRSFRSGRPVSVERHGHAPLAARVAALMRDEPPFDVVHAEQLQALPIAAPARRAGIACVLRAQNVEHAVWEAAAGERGASVWRAAAMRFEARRLRRFEAETIGDVDATIALSPDDAAALVELCPAASSRIATVPPPIPSAWMAPADRSDQSDGRSTFVWIGSAGWAPNDAARDWLLGDIWPMIIARLSDAHLHVFADRVVDARTKPLSPNSSPLERGLDFFAKGRRPFTHREAIVADGSIAWRGAPRESADAFLPGGILLIPMRAAAGVRMRVLEAWARGVPVIASPAAIAGLDAEDGRDVLVAADGRAFAEAATRLVGDRALRARLVDGGRATLARRHDPRRIAEATLDVYRQAIEWRRERERNARQ